MLLRTPYRYEAVRDLIPARQLFRVHDASGVHIANCWSEENAQGVAEALNTMGEAMRLTIENEELRARLEQALLS